MRWITISVYKSEVSLKRKTNFTYSYIYMEDTKMVIFKLSIFKNSLDIKNTLKEMYLTLSHSIVIVKL